MSKPADKAEVVQLPAETPVAVPASQRRGAAQRVGEARDRLTSTSGIRPAFDREIVRLLDAAGCGGGLALRHAVISCHHHPQLPQVSRRAGLADLDPQVANPIWSG